MSRSFLWRVSLACACALAAAAPAQAGKKPFGVRVTGQDGSGQQATVDSGFSSVSDTVDFLSPDALRQYFPNADRDAVAATLDFRGLSGLMLDFGYYTFEKVFDVRMWRDQPVMYWKKLAPRHPLDLAYWTFDRGGGPNAAWFYDSKSAQPKPISIKKLAVFSFDKEAGNLEGISLLRSAYKHWFYKENLYKIDAIQKERHGVGVPIIKLPANFTAQDKALADEFGRNLRSNEKAHVVLPPFWEIMFAKLEGQHVDALASADHHNRMMYENILASFLVGQGESDFAGELFLKSTRYIAEITRDVFNKYCIP